MTKLFCVVSSLAVKSVSSTHMKRSFVDTDRHATTTCTFQGLDGHVICAALLSQYCMMDYDTGQNTDLFPIDVDHTKPIVKRISRVSCV